MKRSELTEALAQPDRAGVFELPVAQEDTIDAAARANGFPCFRILLGDCEETADVLARLAEVLQFPDWFSQDWDSLAECLTDFSWHSAAGYVLVIENSRAFRSAAGDDFDTLIRILSESSASWSGLGVPFWAFVLQ